jgi:hypothetical protein
VLAAAEEKRIRDDLWAAAEPSIDYAAIVEAIKKS